MPVEEMIWVTSEMVDAGLEEYYSRWIALRHSDLGVEREMMAEAFRAMLRCWLGSLPRGSCGEGECIVEHGT